jgi:type IV pilus assembly protein PilE
MDTNQAKEVGHNASERPVRQRRQRGFSILEALAVVTMIGVITVIAYPTLRDQAIKGRRADAHTALLESALKEQQYFAQHGSYTDDMRALGYGADPTTSPKGAYQVDATLTGGGQGFTLKATRQGAQTADHTCGDLTLSHTGVKSAVNNTDSTPGKNCW